MEDLNQLRPEQESGAKKPAPDDVDALLQDVKSLLGETDADIAAEAPAEPDTEDSEPITADDVQIDYGKFYGPEEPGQSKTRYVRAAMIEALSMDYIRTARAKGLREKVVIYSHAWRNALLPVITVLIGWFISIFSGSLIIEQMFALNGMGQLYYQGLMNNDFELALAIQMFYVLIALVGQLITDLSYGIVDPRVRVNK